MPYRSCTAVYRTFSDPIARKKIQISNIYTYTDQMRPAACSPVSMNYIKRHASLPYWTCSICPRKEDAIANKKGVLTRLFVLLRRLLPSATTQITASAAAADPEQTNTRRRVRTCNVCRKDCTWTPPSRLRPLRVDRLTGDLVVPLCREPRGRGAHVNRSPTHR